MSTWQLSLNTSSEAEQELCQVLVWDERQCLLNSFQRYRRLIRFVEATGKPSERADLCIPLSGDELVLRGTGLQPAGEAVEALRRAKRIVVVPCLHLGRYLALSEVATTHYLLFEPMAAGECTTRPGQPPRVQQVRQVIDLERLGPAVAALSDPTRLSVLMALAERGELFAQQIVAALGVHQSTVSRHLAHLERADLVHAHREGSQKRYHLHRQKVREVCHWLLDALG